MDLLSELAKKHKDWCAMVGSFGCPHDIVEDIVQEMYIRLYRYVDEPERIIYENGEINTYYVYVTLRNMYLDYTKMKKRIIFVDPVDHAVDRYEYDPYEYEEAVEQLFNKVWAEVETWEWYDATMFKVYVNSDLSMRDLSEETTISLRSIFNTLKNGKSKVKKACDQEYRDYKEAQKS